MHSLLATTMHDSASEAVVEPQRVPVRMGGEESLQQVALACSRIALLVR